MTLLPDDSTGCWHRAGWVVQDPDTIIQDAMVHVCGHRITEVKSGRKTGPDPIVDHGPGALIPALINAHTHLELGALKGTIPFNQGFDTWVRHLIHAREKLTPAELTVGISAGIHALLDSGCGAVGEIASIGLSRTPFLESPLHGVWFKEYIGNKGPDHDVQKMPSPPESLAGHAPHTTSPDLLVSLKKQTRRFRQPFSIHLAESKNEIDFIRTKSGTWADLLTERGIDYSNWPLPAKSPVRYLDQLNLLDENTLAVHLLNADGPDFELLARRQVRAVACPRSNRHLHQRLPDLMGMQQAGLNISLGTDSLASCNSLSMFDEMAFTAKMFPFLSPRDIFAMATTNAAGALGQKGEIGRVMPGYRAAVIYVELTAAKPDILLEKLVAGPLTKPIERLDRHVTR